MMIICFTGLGYKCNMSNLTFFHQIKTRSTTFPDTHSYYSVVMYAVHTSIA